MALKANAVIRRQSCEEFPQRPDEDLAHYCQRVKAVLDADPEAVALVDSVAAGAAVLDWLHGHECRAERRGMICT